MLLGSRGGRVEAVDGGAIQHVSLGDRRDESVQQRLGCGRAVSYTHLDVYKRQRAHSVIGIHKAGKKPQVSFAFVLRALLRLDIQVDSVELVLSLIHI